MRLTICLALFLCFAPWPGNADEAAARGTQVQKLEITVLSTMLSDARGLGEWGFSALVETEQFSLLYDTGYHPARVLENAKDLGVNLSGVKHVVLSHNHGDHTGGLLTLRRALRGENETALSQVHVGAGLFEPREFPATLQSAGFHFRDMREVRAEYEALGGAVSVHREAVELAPGVWLTGPVPRVHPEKNWSPGVRVQRDGTWHPDEVLEDAALVIDTEHGLVVVTGCGHAGVVNILDYARTLVPGAKIYAVLGGLHLFAAEDSTLDWTAENMRRNGVRKLVGAHCTGLHALYRLRDQLGLDRSSAVVGAVGARFSLETGIHPLRVAR